MNDTTLRVLAVKPEEPPCVKEIAAGLESLQHEVGGDIQAIYPCDDPVAIICNEEGKLNGMPLNRALLDDNGEMYDILAGNFLVVGLGDEDFTSLSEKHIQKYSELYALPQYFVRVNDEIKAIPIPPATSVYLGTAEHALACGERALYRRSLVLNMDCRDAIETVIHDHYNNNRLDKEAATFIVDRYGWERTAYVLANTIRSKDWDGRFSPDNKEWAKSIPAPEGIGGADFRFVINKAHPGLVDLFTTTARREYEPKRESVLDKLRQPVERTAKTTPKYDRGIEI